MNIEDIARIRLAPWRTTQQQRQLAVGSRVACQIVVDDEDIAPLFHEVFSHRGCGEGRNVLNTRRLVCRSDDDDAVGHRVVSAQVCEEFCHSRTALSDGTVDAEDTLVALIQDRVEGDGSLAGLAIPQDQLALPTADRQQRVDDLEAGLQGSRDRCSMQDGGAGRSTGRRSRNRTAPCSSIGRPSASTTRPMSSSPTGMSRMRNVR